MGFRLKKYLGMPTKKQKREAAIEKQARVLLLEQKAKMRLDAAAKLANCAVNELHNRKNRWVLKTVLFLVSLLAFPVCAIDSILEQGAKAEKDAVKKAGKAKAAAVLTFSSGEVVRCVWLARVGDEWRYLRQDNGKLVRTPLKDATAQGAVLDKTPETEVVVHALYCNGRACEATVKTISIPAWPAESPRQEGQEGR